MRAYTNPKYGKGSELWATLDSGESYADSYSGTTVYVCAIHTTTDSAEVGVGESLAIAQSKCGPAPPNSPPLPPSLPCVSCTITTTGGSWASEISWKIDAGTAKEVVNDGAISDNTAATQAACLDSGAHTLDMADCAHGRVHTHAASAMRSRRAQQQLSRARTIEPSNHRAIEPSAPTPPRLGGSLRRRLERREDLDRRR